MSARHLKKKLENDLNLLNELEIKEESDAENLSDLSTSVAGKKKLNCFDLLNQQQSLSESEVKEDDNETENTSGMAHSLDQAKKKKKKRKRKTGRQISTKRSSEDNADIEDEFSRELREVDQIFGTSYQTTQTAPTSNFLSNARTILAVQHKNLNSSYEMKRMFGTKVVQAVDQNKRRNPRGGARPLKSIWLVNAKDNWPPVGKIGIYMSVVQQSESSTPTRTLADKSGIYFAFEHDSSYRQLQQKFLQAVETMDSDNIVKIINQQPYHIDSLIQLSELCKISEDHAMASVLIEHALLALETSFHSMFSLTQGTCRLDYRKQENRALFVVLFKHAQYLESRACSRTALEITKLLLTLDESDPLAVKLVIDYYAIRAKQYEWLVEFYKEFEATNNLSQLPNMAYSYAMALFYIKRTEEADQALQYALSMFPGMLKELLDEISVQVDERCSSHKFFSTTAYTSQSLGLQQLTSLYVCRSKLVWRDSALLPWLEKNVNAVLDKVDAKDEMFNEFTAKRNQRYLNPPRTILRHVVLSDFKEKVPLAQFIKKEIDPILMYDPLPPLDSINIYTKPKATGRTTLVGSPFSMFFQSFLPSFNLQQGAVGPNLQNLIPGGIQMANVGEGDDIEGAVGGHIAAAAELRTSLTSIVDALRDFLTNIRVPERTNDADVDDNGSTDEDLNDYLT